MGVSLSPTSAGRKIADVGDRETPRYRREWQESIRQKVIEIFWIWKVFGFLISVRS